MYSLLQLHSHGNAGQVVVTARPHPRKIDVLLAYRGKTEMPQFLVPELRHLSWPAEARRWSGFFQGFHQIHKALCLMTQFIKLTQSHLHGLRGVSGQVVYVADGLVDLVAHG